MEHCFTDASLLYGDKLVLQIERKTDCEGKVGHVPLTVDSLKYISIRMKLMKLKIHFALERTKMENKFENRILNFVTYLACVRMAFLVWEEIK